MCCVYIALYLELFSFFLNKYFSGLSHIILMFLYLSFCISTRSISSDQFCNLFIFYLCTAQAYNNISLHVCTFPFIKKKIKLNASQMQMQTTERRWSTAKNNRARGKYGVWVVKISNIHRTHFVCVYLRTWDGENEEGVRKKVLYELL